MKDGLHSDDGVLGRMRVHPEGPRRRMIAAWGFHAALPRVWLSTRHTILLGIVLVIGSASALYQTYRLLLPYPDCINAALIYLDVQRESLTAVRHWVLPADNFLLTLYPFSLGWFTVFGTSVLSIVTLSHGIFLLGVLLTGAIVHRVTGDRGRAALSAALLFAGPTNLMYAHQSHPEGHNSTMVYVLLACLIVTTILTSARGEAWKLVGLAFIVAVSTFSDPWFDAVFTAPAGLVLGGLAVQSGPPAARSRRAAGLVLLSVLGGLASGQALYAMAARLAVVAPRSALVGSLDTISVRLHSLGHVLPVLSNIDPREAAGPLEWVFIACSLALTGLAVRHAPSVWHRADASRRFLLAFALLSLASVTLAFLGTPYAAVGGLAPARYLLNIYYVGFLAGIVVLGDVGPRLGWHKLVVIGWLGLFAVPGLWASWRTFEAHGLQHGSLDIQRAILAELKKGGLTRGLAPYSSGVIGANSLTYLSTNQITVRPVAVEVSDGHLRPFDVAINRRWYDERESANFLIVHHSDEPLYEAAAIASFGPPNTTLRYGEYVAWVWHADVMPLLARHPFKP